MHKKRASFDTIDIKCQYTSNVETYLSIIDSAQLNSCPCSWLRLRSDLKRKKSAVNIEYVRLFSVKINFPKYTRNAFWAMLKKMHNWYRAASLLENSPASNISRGEEGEREKWENQLAAWKKKLFTLRGRGNKECASCALYLVIVTNDEIQTEFSRLAAGEGKV